MIEKVAEALHKNLDRKKTRKCLPTFEIVIYFIFWFYILFSGCYQIYKLAYNEITLEYFISNNHVTKSYFGLYLSNVEYMWSDILILFKWGWIYFAVYLVLSKFSRKYLNPTLFMLITTTYTLIVHWYLSSMSFLLFELSIYVIMVLVASATKSKILVWILGLAQLHCLTYVYKLPFFESHYIMQESFSNTALLITRVISIGLLLCDSHHVSFKLLLETSYFYWYFPAVIGCRMMTIRDFIGQIYNPHKIDRPIRCMWSILKIVCVLVLWHFIICLCPFYLVVRSHDIKYLNGHIMVGGQLFHGIHFYIVYYILYNLVFWLSQLDGYLTTEGPTCIAHVALYSTMWREFDRGLHVWIKDHIYQPITSRGSEMLWKNIAVIFSFGFVFVFHGLNISIAIFIISNIIQMFLERCCKYYYRSTKFGVFLEHHLSSNNLLRLIGLASGASFFLSIFGFASMQYDYSRALEIYGSYFTGSFNDYYHRWWLMMAFCYVHGVLCYHVNSCRGNSKVKNLNDVEEIKKHF